MHRLFTILFVSLFGLSVFGENSDLRFLDGLSERGLFETAEIFYVDRIQRISEHERLVLATEFVRTLAHWALQTEPNRRSNILQKRERLEREFLGPVDDGTNPERTLALLNLRFQSVIGDLAIGNERRLEAVVAVEPEHSKAMEVARTQLFDTIEKFKACFEAVNELRQRVGSNADGDFERRTLGLLRTVHFQWGLAQESVALTFPNDSGDRVFCLNAAIEILDETARLQIDDDAVFRSRITIAGCYRLLGNLDRAAEMFKNLQNKPLSLEMQFRANAELIRYYLRLGELDTALKEFGNDRSNSVIVPEFNLARLELFLAENQRQPSEATLDKIIRLVRNIEQRNGLYWGRRARLVLISSDFSSENAELLKLLAEEQFHSGRFAESVRLYDRASEAAAKSKNLEVAFANAKSAVAVLDHVAQRLHSGTAEDQFAVRRQLVDALQSLAVRFADHLDAAELHLEAADEAARLVLEKNLPLERYVELLTEHVDHWPTSEKAPPLLLRAAQILEQQKRPVDALDLLKRIPNGSRIAPDAVNAAVRCFEQQKDIQHSDVADWFERRIAPDGPWSNADVRSALESADYRLRSGNTDAAKNAEGLLRRLLEKCNDLPPTEKAKALSSLVTSLTLQNRQSEAAKILDDLTGDNFASLPPSVQRNLQLTKASVLAVIDKAQDAINILVDFLKKQPNDLEFRETLAEILSRQEQPEALAQSLKLWEGIERSSPKNSEPWWNARESTLNILLKQGRKDEAVREYAVLRLLQPQLGGAARKTRFEAMFNK